MPAVSSLVQTAPAQIKATSVSPKWRPAFCTRRPSSSSSPLVPSQPVPFDVDYDSDSDDSDAESAYSIASSSSSAFEADDESPLSRADYPHRRRNFPFFLWSSNSSAGKSSIPFPSSSFDRPPPRGRHALTKPLRTAPRYQSSQFEPRVTPSFLVGNELGISINSYPSDDDLIPPSPLECEPPTPSWMAGMSYAWSSSLSRPNIPKFSPRSAKVGQRDSALHRFFRARMAHATLTTFL